MDQSLWDVVSAHRGRESTAVQFSTSEHSFAELFRDADRYTLPPGETLLLVGEFSYGLLVAMLACIRCGKSFSCVDTAAYLKYGTRLCFDTCVYSSELGSEMSNGLGRSLTSEHGLSHAWPVNMSDSQPLEANIGFLTSGSTGMPKLVLQRHAAVCRFAVESVVRFGFDNDTRLLMVSSLMWDLMVIELLAVLVAGGTCIVLERKTVVNPLVFGELITNFRINTLQVAPSFLDMIVFFGGIRSTFPTVRTVILTGEPVYSRPHFRVHFPAARLISAYGSCELHNVFSCDVTADIGRAHVPLGAQWNAVRSLEKIPVTADCFQYDIDTSTLAIGTAAAGIVTRFASPYRPEDMFRHEKGVIHYAGRMTVDLSKEAAITLYTFRNALNTLVFSSRTVAFLDALVVHGRIITVASSADDKAIVDDALRQISRTSSCLDIRTDAVIVRAIPRNLHGKVDTPRLRLILEGVKA